MDFTVRKYKELLAVLKNAGYNFQSFAEFLESPKERSIILRHDVDARKYNSLLFAKIQSEEGIKASYYFRTVPQSYSKDIIEEIALLGHEIGYHYENMDVCNGDADKAYADFCQNLEMFRSIVPIKTICMHGSPLSKYDNRILWDIYDYKKLDIIGEPYFDINFNEVTYMTDTGRRWDGDKVSVRDKVAGNSEYRISNNEYRNSSQLLFQSTNDIITAAQNKQLPNQLMITFHPQRWTNKPLPWMWEFVFQNTKNLVKQFLVK